MEKYALILAGGEGRRAGGDVPKQFHLLSGRPLVWWSMRAFLLADPEIRVTLVVHPDFIDKWQEMWMNLPDADRFPHGLCAGGSSRPESVANGLRHISDSGVSPEAVVLIHDGARPLITPDMIIRGMRALQKHQEGVIPAVRSVNSLREIASPGARLDETLSHSVDRARFVEVQTPQIFKIQMLLPLYGDVASLGGFTDDASVAEASGRVVGLYEGDVSNIKVTHPVDFAIAEAILAQRG